MVRIVGVDSSKDFCVSDRIYGDFMPLFRKQQINGTLGEIVIFHESHSREGGGYTEMTARPIQTDKAEMLVEVKPSMCQIISINIS